MTTFLKTYFSSKRSVKKLPNQIDQFENQYETCSIRYVRLIFNLLSERVKFIPNPLTGFPTGNEQVNRLLSYALKNGVSWDQFVSWQSVRGDSRIDMLREESK